MTYVDYQARSQAFKVGDCVFPQIGGTPANGGTVVAIWPAIGMVDVQFPHGSTRYPVEELVISQTANAEAVLDVTLNTVPGGLGTVSVPGGPSGAPLDRTPTRPFYTSPKPPLFTPQPIAQAQPQGSRVSTAYLKKAVYWAGSNRQYKPTKAENETGRLCCPRCEDAILRKVVYKREDGKSVRLFCCPECLFLLRRSDVIGWE